MHSSGSVAEGPLGMPLGISPSVRPTRLRSTSLLTYSGRNVLCCFSRTTPRRAEGCYSFWFPTIKKTVRAIMRAGIRACFSPEYKGRPAYVNKILDLVRKLEQPKMVYGFARQSPWKQHSLLDFVHAMMDSKTTSSTSLNTN